MTGADADELDELLRAACLEEGLDPVYRDCVRPLLREGALLPRCCGGDCEPCAEQLIRIAAVVRARRLGSASDSA
jgi:hypothetical protein